VNFEEKGFHHIEYNSQIKNIHYTDIV